MGFFKGQQRQRIKVSDIKRKAYQAAGNANTAAVMGQKEIAEVAAMAKILIQEVLDAAENLQENGIGVVIDLPFFGEKIIPIRPLTEKEVNDLHK